MAFEFKLRVERSCPRPPNLGSTGDALTSGDSQDNDQVVTHGT